MAQEMDFTEIDAFIASWKMPEEVIMEEKFDEEIMKQMQKDRNIPSDDKKKLDFYYRERSGIGNKFVKYDYNVDNFIIENGKKRFIGRMKPNKGLAGFRRDIRNPLTQKFYWDIDFVNCAYQIILGLAKKEGLNYGFIEKYVNERNEILKAVNPDRKTAKMIMLSLAFGGSIKNYDEDLNEVSDNYQKNQETLDFMKSLKNEIEALANHFMIDKRFDEWLKMKIKDEKKKIKLKDFPNARFKLLSRITQDIECHHLIFLRDYLITKQRYMRVLIFDGGNVEKLSYEHEFPPELLRECENAMDRKFHFGMKLDVKPIEHNYKPPESELTGVKAEIERLNRTRGYNAVKEEFEKNNFKINSSVCFVEISKYNEIIMRKKTDLKDRYQEMFYNEYSLKDGEIEEKRMKFIDKWLDDDQKRFYEDIKFDPSANPSFGEDVYNTFKGLHGEKLLSKFEDILDCDETIIENQPYEEEGVWKYKNKDLELFMSHFKDLVGNNAENFIYLWYYLASIVQNRNQTKKSIIFQSKQGVGKDKFFKFLVKHIFGREYVALISEPKDIFQRFNLTLENKFLCILSETEGRDLFEESAKLKALIDSTGEITIERKGVNQYNMPNRLNMIFFTNNKNPVKIEKGDRRFVVFECNNEWVECDEETKSKHFAPIVELFDHDEASYDAERSERLAKLIYIMLKRMDLSKFDLTKSPKSNAYKFMQESNTSVIQQFMIHLYEKMTESKEEKYEKKGLDFFTHFNNWKQKAGFDKISYTSTKFLIEIKRDYPFIRNIKPQNISHYRIIYEDLKDFVEKQDL